jgi:hypothetical protein
MMYQCEKHAPRLKIQLKYVRGENAKEGVWTMNCARGIENQNQLRFRGIKRNTWSGSRYQNIGVFKVCN